jgi:hypothetical protein
MAIITAFQAEDGGSIPPTRSIELSSISLEIEMSEDAPSSAWLFIRSLFISDFFIYVLCLRFI